MGFVGSPQLVSILREGRKSANIHLSSGVIWGIPVKVGPAGIRGDRHIMPHQPHFGVIALWRKPSNVFLPGCLADAAEYNKGVTVVPGLARTKLDVVPLSADCELV